MLDRYLAFDGLKPTLDVAGFVASLGEGRVREDLNNAAEELVGRAVDHPMFSRYAGQLLQRRNALMVPDTFSGYVKRASQLSDDIREIDDATLRRIDNEIDYSRDAQYDFFAWRTLEKSYLLRSNGEIIERPQYLWMRVALGIHGPDLDSAFESYHAMSTGKCTHATPTLFNSGLVRAQMASCFLLAMQDDSIEGIFDTLKQCALISKSAGGIGIHIHNIRAKGSRIKGTQGTSNGIVPMMRVFNNTARYVDQGGGKRKGSFAVYLSPHHPDILDFLEMKLNHGADELRARDLFYGLWVSDLFMRRVHADQPWSVFCPSKYPPGVNLSELYGTEFEEAYARLEEDGLAERAIPARQIWNAMMTSMIETGTPYLLFKDAVNAKSNQKNIGPIMSSNLCTEIMQVSTPSETAVCNLASLALPAFIGKNPDDYDFEGLSTTTRLLVRNIEKVITRTHYPIPEAALSNFRHRPMSIGVQGLADVFMLHKIAFDSDKARELNKRIFATIYFAALSESAELARVHGPYSTFEGSPASKGILQFDLWGEEPHPMYDWGALKKTIADYGLRHSLLVGLMPTASSATILMNLECFEPATTNLFTRTTLTGEHVKLNEHLVRDLEAIGLWDHEMRDDLVRHRGSVQHIKRVPDDLKPVYRTAYEISMRSVIDMSADRGIYVDQSSSKNLYFPTASPAVLTAALFHSWGRGEKTGSYYIRTRSATTSLQSCVDPRVVTAPLSPVVEESCST
jgi:ribonucleoside-diphosphate reductase alpha chain